MTRAAWILLAGLLAWPAPARADDLASRAVAILSERCAECHDDEGSSQLSLLSRASALAGGKRGPALVPHDARGSRLFQSVAHLAKPTMPPDERLSDPEIDVLRRWIDAGAPWPGGGRSAEPRWWAFEKPARPAVPASNDPWVRTPIDAFILRKLRAEGLRPAPAADRATLIRRASYALHGLPPTAAEVRAFAADRSPDAYEKVIDRLLASPRYGEHWARHWLDLARYADTAGFEHDAYLLHAWRYRDYVIASFNSDKPYSRFLSEQIAGDELWPDDPTARLATGLFTVGPTRDMEFAVEDINRAEMLTDYVDTTGALFLGITVGCARCHDHKYDPISQKDYYRLQAIFAPAVKTPVRVEYTAAGLRAIADAVREVRLIGVAEEIKDAKSREDQGRLDQLGKRLVEIFDGFGPQPVALGITDPGRQAPATLLPGRADGPVQPIRPGFPKALGGGDIPEPALDARTTGRRRALAEWLSSPDHPLTARVMVNRVWQLHFGRGIVASASDFGQRGGVPAHRELLDWLATDFVASGWSMKKLHRKILLSGVYRQAVTASARARQVDAANAFLSHMSRRRLSSEEIRDTLLQATGALNLAVGGRPVVPPLAPEELDGISIAAKDAWIVTPDRAEHGRRSIYLLQRRGFRQPLMEVFDAPDGNLHCPRRESSTSAPQALTLLNGTFTHEQARRLAEELGKQVDPKATITEAWRRALSRDPAPEELERARAFLVRQTELLGTRSAALTELCRALFNLNELLYLE